MALHKLILPKMGESVAEATIVKWTKAVGERIEADETIIEIATDKVDSEVPSPVSGKLIERLFNETDIVPVGSIIGVIETADVAEPAPPAKPAEPVAMPERVINGNGLPKADDIPGIELLKQQPLENPVSRFYSPLIKSIAVQEKVTPQELDTIPGTGAEGRLTKEDLLLYIKIRSQPKPKVKPKPVAEEPLKAPEPSTTQEPKPEEQPKVPATVQKIETAPPKPTQMQRAFPLNAGDEVVEMDRMRRLIADHMVMSVHTSPHVTSFVEADVTNLVLWRDKVKDAFEQREKMKITFTPIFIEAVARALKEMPMVNVAVNGTQIIKRKDINIGMATALPSGNLIVPVIRRADEFNLVGLSKAVNDLANRARTGKLQPHEVKDGTFTITNIGSFGNIMGTPIINQPQVAILALGAIKKKPAVVETPEGDFIAVRHLMYLSLSYDHRVVDGALGGTFVRRVADHLEAWDVNRAY